jgi:hypothetical protein
MDGDDDEDENELNKKKRPAAKAGPRSLASFLKEKLRFVMGSTATVRNKPAPAISSDELSLTKIRLGSK